MHDVTPLHVQLNYGLTHLVLCEFRERLHDLRKSLFQPFDVLCDRRVARVLSLHLRLLGECRFRRDLEKLFLVTSSWEQLASSICEQHKCVSIDSIDLNKKFHDHDDHSQEVGSGVVGALAASESLAQEQPGQ